MQNVLGTIAIWLIRQHFTHFSVHDEGMRLSLLLTIIFVACMQANAQHPLASRVLVVYVAGDADSQEVATHYIVARGVQPSNWCGLTLPNPSATSLNREEYDLYVKQPIQNCLHVVGEASILYIVLAYVRPYAVDPGSGLHNYSLDSYLSDIWDRYANRTFNPYPTKEHPYYANSQSQGNVFAPFQSLAAFREASPESLIYSVWRLDGASAGLAMNLIDNAMTAEAAGGPISSDPGSVPSACLDLLIDPLNSPDSGYRAADWDLRRASDFLSSTGRFQVTADTNGEVFGTSPATTCPNSALYAGWYNYGRYNDAFSWDVGAIGWDLDSGALADPRGGAWWGSNALQHGITVTSGPMNEPYLEGMARPGGTFRNLLEGANVGDAFLRNTRWLKWMILNVGDPLYTPFPSKVAPFDAYVPANSLSLSPRQLVSGNKQITAVLTLAQPAPEEGLAVSLSTDNGVLGVPETVQVDPKSSIVTFTLDAGFVPYPMDIQVTASTPTFSVTNTASLYPLLSDLKLSTSTVSGGGTVIGSVLLNENAATDGVTIQLASDNPELAAVPATVFVPGGRSHRNVTISTSAQPEWSGTVNITASYAGAQVTTALSVNN